MAAWLYGFETSAPAAPLPRGPCSVRPPQEVADGQRAGPSTPPLRERGREASRGCEVVVHELKDPWADAAAKYPNLDWRLKSKMEFSGYHQLSSAAGSTSYLDGRGQTPWTLQAGPSRRRSGGGGEKRTIYKSFEKGGFWLVQNRDDLGLQDVLPGLQPMNYVPPSTIMPSSPVCPRPFWGVWQARRWRTSTATRHGTKSSFATACSTISRSVSSDHRSPPTA